MSQLITKDNYPYQSWSEKYPNHIVSLNDLSIDHSWKDIFDKLKTDKRYTEIEEYLSYCLESTKGKVKIYPYPDLIYSAFNHTPLDKVKVVFIGQDPYFNSELDDNSKIIPQAMGLSFSVPVGVTVPPSLANIYKNMVANNELIKKPSHGNLEFWAYQGCLMINTVLTVQAGVANSHADYWVWCTDQIIKYISDNTKNIIFVLWGAPALDKLKLIDKTTHKILISSHPSGLSCARPLRSYSSFNNSNHFGEINKYLEENGKEKIIWQLF